MKININLFKYIISSKIKTARHSRQSIIIDSCKIGGGIYFLATDNFSNERKRYTLYPRRNYTIVIVVSLVIISRLTLHLNRHPLPKVNESVNVKEAVHGASQRQATWHPRRNLVFLRPQAPVRRQPAGSHETIKVARPRVERC